MTKVLATGDLHFSAGMDRLGPWRLDDQEQVWRRICDLALEESVDAVLLAGDVFDRPRPSPEVLRAFLRPLRFLRAAGVDVLTITGNVSHDIVNADVACALEIFDDLMDVRRQPGIWNGRGVQVACLPSVPVHRLVASSNGGDRDALNELAAAHLLNVARGLRAQCEGPAVLLAHWSVSGAALPSGLPIEMAHEPILDLGELEAMDWDAIVLGHIHKPQVLSQIRLADVREADGARGAGDAREVAAATSSLAYGANGEPSDQGPGMGARTPGPIFYVGSPMPLSFGEPGEHGVWIVEVDAADGETVGRFVPIESRPFMTSYFDFAGQNIEPGSDPVSDLTNWPELPDAPVFRMRYTATEEQQRRIDQHALRQALLDAGAVKVFIEPEIVRATRARVEGIDETLDEKAAFALWLDAERVDAGLRAKLGERHHQLLEEAAA